MQLSWPEKSIFEDDFQALIKIIIAGSCWEYDLTNLTAYFKMAVGKDPGFESHRHPLSTRIFMCLA